MLLTNSKSVLNSHYTGTDNLHHNLYGKVTKKKSIFVMLEVILLFQNKTNIKHWTSETEVQDTIHIHVSRKHVLTINHES